MNENMNNWKKKSKYENKNKKWKKSKYEKNGKNLNIKK